jgi:hypothetical protein
MRIVCVVGLPGSGKTHHMLENRGVDDVFVDDPKLFLAYKWTPQQLAEVNTLWIADPYFCIPEVRAQAEHKLIESYGVSPTWIFFENDPEACMKNVARRNDGRKVRGLIHALKGRYEIPPGATVIPVWRPESE